MVELIYDRTQADVDRAKAIMRGMITGQYVYGSAEWSEYLAGLKGCYNAADINRVSFAHLEISGLIAGLRAELRLEAEDCGCNPDDFQLPAGEVDVLPTMLMREFPDEKRMAQYLANTRILRDICLPGDTTVLPTSMSKLGYRGANAIEEVLSRCEAGLDAQMAELREKMARAVNSRIYAGEAYAGEV